MPRKERTPFVSLHVDPELPIPISEQRKAVWEKVIENLSGTKLTTTNDWLTPAVAALVVTAAHVSAHFATAAGDHRTNPAEREMLLSLETALIPFMRKNPT